MSLVTTTQEEPGKTPLATAFQEKQETLSIGKASMHGSATHEVAGLFPPPLALHLSDSPGFGTSTSGRAGARKTSFQRLGDW